MISFLPLNLILGAATALILIGGALFLKTLQFRTKAQPVDARLIKGEEYGDYREDSLMAVRLSYEYTAPDGRVIQADHTSLLRRIPSVGSRRAMLVDPEKPKSLQLPGILEYFVPLALVIAGIIILFMTTMLPLS